MIVSLAEPRYLQRHRLHFISHRASSRLHGRREAINNFQEHAIEGRVELGKQITPVSTTIRITIHRLHLTVVPAVIRRKYVQLLR